MKTYDAIVIGAGGIGSAAMHSLAARGLTTLGIDRFSPPHDRGSSHGETRVIRQAYFEHPDYVPLLLKTYELWRQLEEKTGAKLYHPCGLLEVGPADGIVVPGVLRAAREHSLAVEELLAEEVTGRWPALRLPDGLTAVFERDAGYLEVERCVEANLACAQNLGAQLLVDTIVSEWSVDDGHAVVQAGGEKYVAKHLVITAGPWAGQMVAELGQHLTTLRKSLYWFDADGVAAVGELPVYLYELPEGICYGFPSVDGSTIKIAEHTGGVEVKEPASGDLGTDEVERQKLVGFLKSVLPGVSGEICTHKNCYYTMTPDHHFVVDRHPEFQQVAYAVGMSGHGFKFAPVLGEALADLLLNGKTDLPISFLSSSRFG